MPHQRLMPDGVRLALPYRSAFTNRTQRFRTKEHITPDKKRKGSEFTIETIQRRLKDAGVDSAERLQPLKTGQIRRGTKKTKELRSLTEESESWALFSRLMTVYPARELRSHQYRPSAHSLPLLICHDSAPKFHPTQALMIRTRTSQKDKIWLNQNQSQNQMSTQT